MAPQRDRHHGGQELPDELQDRPEQNEGYDEAVEGVSTATPLESSPDFEVDALDERGSPESVHLVPDPAAADDLPETVDEKAERDAIAEIRRRERSNR